MQKNYSNNERYQNESQRPSASNDFMQKLALAMRYDSIMTSMRHGKADDSMVQKAIEIAKRSVGTLMSI